MASHKLLPIRWLISELHKHGPTSVQLDHPFSMTHTSTLEASTVYEDNVSCIVLTHSKGTKVCTKHISLNDIASKITLELGTLRW
jgi:hypothetical protein